jgi:hypothetical protein
MRETGVLELAHETTAVERVEAVPLGQHGIVGVHRARHEGPGVGAQPGVGYCGDEVHLLGDEPAPGLSAATSRRSPTRGSASQASASRT